MNDKKKVEKTYRCTRNEPDPNTPLWNRQGYYFRAFSKKDALLRMKELFPGDKLGFTVKEW